MNIHNICLSLFLFICVSMILFVFWSVFFVNNFALIDSFSLLKVENSPLQQEKAISYDLLLKENVILHLLYYYLYNCLNPAIKKNGSVCNNNNIFTTRCIMKAMINKKNNRLIKSNQQILKGSSNEILNFVKFRISAE